jgi:hypothetical protein
MLYVRLASFNRRLSGSPYKQQEIAGSPEVLPFSPKVQIRC